MSSIEHEIAFPELPYYLTVIRKIDEKTDQVTVTVKSRVHVNKSIEIPNTWSIGYVQAHYQEFRSTVLSFVVRRYNLKLEAPKYV